MTNNNCTHDLCETQHDRSARHNSREIFPYPLQTAALRGATYEPLVRAVTARWLSRALDIYIFTIAGRKCVTRARAEEPFVSGDDYGFADGVLSEQQGYNSCWQHRSILAKTLQEFEAWCNT